MNLQKSILELFQDNANNMRQQGANAQVHCWQIGESINEGN
jgi:hypothetical protein